MSNHLKDTLQYGCECGKEFSGEPKRILLILKMHYKKCKCPRTADAHLEPIIIENTRRNRNGSVAKTITGENIQLTSKGVSALKSLYGSS